MSGATRQQFSNTAGDRPQASEDYVSASEASRAAGLTEKSGARDTSRPAAVGPATYSGDGPFPHITCEREVHILNISGADPQAFGLTASDVTTMERHVTVTAKLNRISLELSAAGSDLLDSRHVHYFMKTVLDQYATKFVESAAKKSFDVVSLNLTAAELIKRARQAFARTAGVSKISIPLMIETPRIAAFIDVARPANQEGLVVSVNSQELTKHLREAGLGEMPTFFWIFAQIWQKATCNPAERLAIPAIGDLFALFMRVASGSNVDRVLIPCVTQNQLPCGGDEALFQDLVIQHSGGWTSYYCQSAGLEFKEVFLARLTAERKKASRASALYAGRDQYLGSFVRRQHGTSHIYGLAVLTDSDVVGLCILPPHVSRGVAARFHLSHPTKDTDRHFHAPLAPQLTGYDIQSSFLDVEVSDDRLSATVVGIHPQGLAALRAKKTDGAITSEDVMDALKKYGIVHGVNAHGDAFKAILSHVNGHGGSCAGVGVASTGLSPREIRAQIMESLEVYVSHDAVVMKGQLLARHRSVNPPRDIYGTPLTISPCLTIGDSVSYEDGAYIAAQDGSVWTALGRGHEAGQNPAIGINDTIYFEDELTPKQWALRIGPNVRHINCSVRVRGDISGLSGFCIGGDVSVSGSVTESDLRIHGNLSVVSGGITLGGRSMTIKGAVDCDFVQGFKADDQRKTSATPGLGLLIAKTIDTGFIIGCACFADSIAIYQRADRRPAAHSGSISSSVVFATTSIVCDTVGGNIDAAGAALTVGVPAIEQARFMRNSRRAETFQDAVRHAQASLRVIDKKSRPTAVDLKNSETHSQNMIKFQKLAALAQNYARRAELAVKQSVNRRAYIVIRREAKYGAKIKIGLSPVIHVSEHNQSTFMAVMMAYDGASVRTRPVIS